MIPNILQWAQQENSIRAIILVGSRAVNNKVDAFSDYDLAIFCETHRPYIQDEQWLSRIGKVWVCVHEQMRFNHRVFPVRLVIFEGGEKVDFAFYPLELLQALVRLPVLPEAYDKGYTVLLDKDNVTKSMAKPVEKEAQKPNGEEFDRVVKEFWFEAYHVAKYLKREDLWSVKFRSNGLHVFLLKMIEWHEEARGEWREKLPANGKHMRLWVEEKTWRDLHKVFAHFDLQDSWRALTHTMGIFRELAKETSQMLGYRYPYEVDQKLSGFIADLEK